MVLGLDVRAQGQGIAGGGDEDRQCAGQRAGGGAGAAELVVRRGDADYFGVLGTQDLLRIEFIG